MRTPSIPAFVFLLAAVPVLAQTTAQKTPATPGTASPHSSGDWGKDEAELRQRAKVIMAKLIKAANAGVVVDGKTITYGGTPDFVIDLQHAVIGGTPAAAFGKGIGLNGPGKTVIDGTDHSGNDLIFTGNALYTMGDQPEAAVFIAHEIGHLANGDPKTLAAEQSKIVDELFGVWSVANTIPDGEPSRVTVARFMKDSAPQIQAKLTPIQAKMEDAADKYGRELAVKADPAWEPATVTAYQRAQDWLWALKLDMDDPSHGGTIADRAAKNVKWLEEATARRKRNETSLRRAKCNSQGVSCE